MVPTLIPQDALCWFALIYVVCIIHITLSLTKQNCHSIPKFTNNRQNLSGFETGSVDDWIFFLSSTALLPTFHTNSPGGPHFAQMGLILPRIPPNPGTLLSNSTPLLEIYTYTKHPRAHPKTPLFLAWTWNALQSGQFGPQLGKMFVKWAKPF